MSKILETWQHTNTCTEATRIPPDGCVDLIVARPKNKKPFWFVSSLQKTVSAVVLEQDVSLIGCRLSPGVRVDVPALSRALCNETSLSRAKEYLEDSSLVDKKLECAINLIASGRFTPRETARELGVTNRTLERWFAGGFLPSPDFWCALSRARQAAKSLTTHAELADIAFQHGFSDQPHMTREFKRWFGLTPFKLKNDLPFLQSILQAGLGTV
jgi:AraC-like DNA-binding protein